MKKLFLSILAVAALASCSKDESFYTEQDSEIKLAPVASLTTKANVHKAIDGTKYPDAEHFTVIGYWANEGAGSVFETGSKYLDAVDFAKQQTSPYWAGAGQSYYWPKNGSLRFACYSPTDLENENINLSHDLATDTWTVDGYTQSNTTENTIDFMIAQTPPSYTAQTASENVSVVFEHALSWLTFRAKAQDSEAAKAFVIKGITVNSVNTVANLVANKDGKVWSDWNTPLKYDVFSGTQGLNVEPYEFNNTGVVIIPQATTTVTVTFTQKDVKDTEGNLVNQSLEIPLILDGKNTPWEAGKHYIYTLLFGLDEILINPSVDEWIDINVPVIDATSIEVNNEVELISAVAAGKSVRLINDITVTEPVVVNGGDVIVELNGHTVQSIGDVFEVRAGTLSINGPGLVSAASDNREPYCAVWAYGDAIVNIYGGEFKAGYPSGDYNDLIYAKENATINIHGGKFYNSGKDNAFVLNLKDSDRSTAHINVYGGSFEKFNPANNNSENAGTNFVADGYNVIQEGDWYFVYPSQNANIVLKGATTFLSSINVVNGTIDGANNTLTVTTAPENNESTYGLICPKGNVTVSNLTIDGGNLRTSNDKGLRGIYVTKAGNYVYNNVTVSGVLYPIHVNTKENVTIKVSNSNLEGWVSYGTSTTADFTNVTFTKNTTTGYAMFRPYGTTVLTNCNFGAEMEIDLSELGTGKTISFIGCTYNNAPLTMDNIQNYNGKESFVTIK